MNIELTFSNDHVAWDALAEVFERAPLGKRNPEQLRRAFERSFLVCFAFDGSKLVGGGRMVSDGEYYGNIYDVVVLPEYQGRGVGRRIVDALLQKQDLEFILLTATNGKEPFYRKLGFRHHKTAMAIYRGSKAARAEIYLE